jgi:nucleoid DNA-binding protein
MTEKGFSKRRAELAVNAVFDQLSKALARGEVVEIPGGWLRVTNTDSKPRQELHAFRNINTNERYYKLVRYGQRRNKRLIRFSRILPLIWDLYCRPKRI